MHGVRLKTNPLDSLIGLIDLNFGTVERRSSGPRVDLGFDHANVEIRDGEVFTPSYLRQLDRSCVHAPMIR